MKADILLYEAGIVVLIVAIIAMAFVLRKLTMIVKQKQSIWLLPVAAALLLAAALGFHAYASFKLLPDMGAKISMMSSQEALLDAVKMDEVKASAQAMKTQMINLKAASFTCFFAAALMLLISTAVYIRWISK